MYFLTAQKIPFVFSKPKLYSTLLIKSSKAKILTIISIGGHLRKGDLDRDTEGWLNAEVKRTFVLCSVMSTLLWPRAPLPMGFFRQEYWNGLPFSPLGDLSDPGVEPSPPASPTLESGFFTSVSPGKSQREHSHPQKESNLRRNQPCPYLHQGLLAPSKKEMSAATESVMLQQLQQTNPHPHT